MREKKEIIITGKHVLHTTMLVLHTTMLVYTFFIGFAFIRQDLELPMLIPYGFYLLTLILEKMEKSGKSLFEIKIER
ncbi:TPA: hypothetical protein VB844_000747 [Streptococcus suis]|uniref:hypothetical protein n=1 Tax=Streptococcus suis TaxID=1307 RepID=UPI002119ADC8|nr:hypothetical protein [Streptococcus suis]HEP1812147.1 hypothetical protein [Streptococcus suis]HEP1831011.1 hypothetical protein [Streptococcus suis]